MYVDNSLITPAPAPAGLPAPGAECGGERAEAPLVCTGVPLLGQDCRQHRQPGQHVELQINLREDYAKFYNHGKDPYQALLQVERDY